MSSKNRGEFERQFGNRPRRMRKAKKLSQEELAHLAGCDVSTIGRIERGEKSPRLALLVSLAETLGTTVSDLTDCRPRARGQDVRREFYDRVDALMEKGSKQKVEMVRMVMESVMPYGRKPVR
ncbi:MAG: helix-turn-helix transcriptional regulator [Planctomycetota bacterium]|nr:helix-turn-helix transcriptional regulator [Planctomycetota bacterium]